MKQLNKRKELNLRMRTSKINIFKGAVIDDLDFKNYKTSLNSNEKVIYLGPRNIESII